MLAREKTGKHSFTKAVCEPGYQTNDIVGRNWKWLGTVQTQVVNSVNVRQFLSRNMGNRREHYSRTCWEPEEVIDRKERKNLARLCQIEVWQRCAPGWQASSSPSRQDSACRYDGAHSEKPTKSASADPVCSLDGP